MGTLEFWVIVPSALTAAYLGIKLSCFGATLAPKQKVRLASLCCLALAVTLGAGGLISISRISSSLRPQLEGVISNLHQVSGKSAASYFILNQDIGAPISLRCSYYGPRLQNGIRVHIQTLDEYKAVLHLEILSGSSVGWSLDESDGLGSAYGAAYAGLALFVLAIGLAVRSH